MREWREGREQRKERSEEEEREGGMGEEKGERSGGIVEGHNVLFMAFLFHTLHHISSDS